MHGTFGWYSEAITPVRLSHPPVVAATVLVLLCRTKWGMRKLFPSTCKIRSSIARIWVFSWLLRSSFFPFLFFPLLLLFKILIFVGGWIAACIISVCRSGFGFLSWFCCCSCCSCCCCYLLLCLFHLVFGVGVACVCSLVKGGWIFACRGSLDFVVAGVFVPLWFLVLELLCVSVFWCNEGCGTRLRMWKGRRRRLE